MSVWKLITQMWNIDPNKRPSFKEIKQKLSKLRLLTEQMKSSTEIMSYATDLKSVDSPPTDDQTYAFSPNLRNEGKSTDEEGRSNPTQEVYYDLLVPPSTLSSQPDSKQLNHCRKYYDQCEKNYRDAKQKYKESKKILKEMEKRCQKETASESSHDNLTSQEKLTSQEILPNLNQANASTEELLSQHN